MSTHLSAHLFDGLSGSFLLFGSSPPVILMILFSLFLSYICSIPMFVALVMVLSLVPHMFLISLSVHQWVTCDISYNFQFCFSKKRFCLGVIFRRFGNICHISSQTCLIFCQFYIFIFCHKVTDIRAQEATMKRCWNYFLHALAILLLFVLWFL